MKKFTALLLALAMLLPACSAANNGADSPDDPSQSTSQATVDTTTTAEPTVPTDTLPATVPSTDQPQTDPVTTEPAADDAPVTTEPSTTEPATTTSEKPTTSEQPATTTKPVTPTTKPVETAKPVTTEKPTTTVPVTTTKPVAHTHSYSWWKTVIAATCTAAGTIKRTCSCGAEDIRSVAATGHSYGVWTVTKVATIDAAGQEARTCEDCQKKETRTVAKLAASLYSLFPIDNASRVTLVSSTAGGFANETAERLFDSAPYTKLCTDTTGYSIVWKLDKAAKIYGYSLMMGNDTAQYDRRPTAWTLEASTNGSNWKTVSNVSNGNLPAQNYFEKIYTIDAGKYQYFRFTLKAPNQVTQMSEITLYTNEVPQTPALQNALGSDKLAESKNMTAGLAYIKRIIDDYYNRDTHIVGEQPGETRSTTLWPATSFLEAVAEAYRACPDDPYIYSTYVDLLNNCLPANFRVEATISTPNRGDFDVVYYNAVANNTGDYYYDDDAWVCLQFLNAYDLLGDKRFLDLAEESLEFFWTGWDDEFGGGIYWDKRYFCKNTCADGPIAIAFLRAYELTGKADYLEKGIKIYDWLRDVMLDNNLYIDNIGFKETNGVIDYGGTVVINDWKAAYNQGTPLAVGALLYRITGEQRYLDETTAVWNATIDHMFDGSGSNTTMNGNPIYRSWCIGWLVKGFMMYYEVDPNQKTTAMDKMLSVLEDERKTLNYTFDTYDIDGKYVRTDTITGYYDPYFCTGDWEERYEPGKNNPDVNLKNKTQILQPSGVATTFLLSGFYELSLD